MARAGVNQPSTPLGLRAASPVAKSLAEIAWVAYLAPALSEPLVPHSKPRHFSMIRDFALADVITLANGCAGMGAILAVLHYLTSSDRGFVWLAVVLLPVAGVFDYLDGCVARWRKRQSALGAQLDSLADLISFGVAPATLGFALGLDGGWDAMALLFFVAAGLSRLARYNVTAQELSDDSGKVRYFEGTPIPSSVLLVGLWALFLARDTVGPSLPGGSIEFLELTLHPLVLVYVASGCAMVSKTLRIPKF